MSATRQRRGGKPLKRVTARRAERRTIVVFCEGSKSEPAYVNGVRRLPGVTANTAMTIVVDPIQGTPVTLVEAAIRKSQDDEVDECWCLFDVEWPLNHPRLAEAVDLATRNGIHLAISNPCFELWLLLHHQDWSRFENTDVVERASRALEKRKGKSIDAAFYLPHRQEAVRRAVVLEQRHSRSGTTLPDDNPSSGMHKFLAAVERPR
ncbi:RloB family protein [Symbioplanes lichenis]|uniref:RloB family protein n=1 Tax=Symbioplanes lichenis TaxID=1629072 RepID=UPI00273A4963|nr:RloB family protein [Actinoplanes lichenis]